MKSIKFSVLFFAFVVHANLQAQDRYDRWDVSGNTMQMYEIVFSLQS